MENIVKPKSKDPSKSSPGYIGYLWKDKDLDNKSPHELIPLDFTDTFTISWWLEKDFATKAFLIAMHVPISFVKDKNKITRALYRIAKSGINIKNGVFLMILKI